MIPVTSATQLTSSRKWKILFESTLSEWISFKPKLGNTVYTCYSCGNMFSSKTSFQDHVNRRIITVGYRCGPCASALTFYNRCAFLLHTRSHYTQIKGEIDMKTIEIQSLPFGFMGFAPNPIIYNETDKFVDIDLYLNSQFYTPDQYDAERQILVLKPYDVVFEQNDERLVLKQVCSNIPLCKFVRPETLDDLIHKQNEKPVQKTAELFQMPVISKIESLSASTPIIKAQKGVKCPECQVVQDKPMMYHFLNSNKPVDEKLHCLVCKFIAPTECSLKAHTRVHDAQPPFVCPECGKTFDEFAQLNQHIDDVCFHSTKQARYRCAGRKCGKLFASSATYSAHFKLHLENLFQCSVCSMVFLKLADFEMHAKQHDSCRLIKTFSCSVCQHSSEILTLENYKQHIDLHIKDRNRSLYVHVCKSCRSYFRSNATYATHLIKCSRPEKNKTENHCKACGEKLAANEKICSKCTKGHIQFVQRFSARQCWLCDEEITPEKENEHLKICKYRSPTVVVEKLASGDSSSETSKSDDSLRKKRKRTSQAIVKGKKLSTEENSNEPQADEPVSFDGTYYCKLCDFKQNDRIKFHEHIITHRDVSTAFQCMECGECFVVQPSLVKHLLHYHKIADYEGYMKKNDCYNKKAVEEAKNGEIKGPLKENQCSECLKEFDDALSLKTHFRVHGLAFLMKKS